MGLIVDPAVYYGNVNSRDETKLALGDIAGRFHWLSFPGSIAATPVNWWM